MGQLAKTRLLRRATMAPRPPHAVAGSSLGSIAIGTLPVAKPAATVADPTPTRTVTVGRRIHIYRGGRSIGVPFIRLSGKWLERAGFRERDRVEVWIGQGEIRLVCHHALCPLTSP